MAKRTIEEKMTKKYKKTLRGARILTFGAIAYLIIAIIMAITSGNAMLLLYTFFFGGVAYWMYRSLDRKLAGYGETKKIDSVLKKIAFVFGLPIAIIIILVLIFLFSQGAVNKPQVEEEKLGSGRIVGDYIVLDNGKEIRMARYNSYTGEAEDYQGNKYKIK
ncbi:MAG: hypothetical protein FWD49_08115 [Firmicutes bacterium]|nr:hypothetical protein [Bacillota bacterium]